MIEDFHEKKHRKRAVNKTTPQAPTTSGSNLLGETTRGMPNPTTYKLSHKGNTVITENENPDMDSPININMDPLSVKESLGVAETLPTPETPFNYGTAWEETKSSVLWLLVVSNVSMISYALGKRNGRARTKAPKSRNMRTQPSSSSTFYMNPLRNRSTMQEVSPDGFNNVDLRAYGHYESVNSLPPPPTGREITSM